jgi:hypothetical protein
MHLLLFFLVFGWSLFVLSLYMLFAYLIWLCSVAVEGSSPPREGAILTRLLELFLLNSKQLKSPDGIMFGSRIWLQFCWILCYERIWSSMHPVYGTMRYCLSV